MQLLLYKSNASTVQYCEAHGFSAVGWGGGGILFQGFENTATGSNRKRYLWCKKAQLCHLKWDHYCLTACFTAATVLYIIGCDLQSQHNYIQLLILNGLWFFSLENLTICGVHSRNITKTKTCFQIGVTYLICCKMFKLYMDPNFHFNESVLAVML